MSHYLGLNRLLKTIMGKVLVERNEAHEEIFLQMDEMQMELLKMNRKIDRLLSVNVDGVGPSHSSGVGSHAAEPPLEVPPGPIH
jgi:hypothetical protein